MGVRRAFVVAGCLVAVWTAADVLDARSTASPCAATILDGEIGGYGYEPYIDGADGEKGPFQLHPLGKLPVFVAWARARGEDPDPHNPWQTLVFVEEQIAAGQGYHWSTAPPRCRFGALWQADGLRAA